jgi:hypothetical protein
MNQQPCHECRIPVKRADAVQRSYSLKLRVFCKPCAEDLGLIDLHRPVLSLVAS